MIAASFPNPGCVVVIRDYESPGPIGWHGNNQNRVVGWFWYYCGTRGNERRGEPFKKRDLAFSDAQKEFPNITGWQETRRNHFAAEVNP